jgi:phenylpyruvate tautomerase PptA (4-oxalocrotonate tautomerase family)
MSQPSSAVWSGRCLLSHRFIHFEPDDFFYPPGRSEHYTIVEISIVEISMFEGRSIAAKKRLLRLLFERAETVLGLAPIDLEITISETPRYNWGIRGKPATSWIWTIKSKFRASLVCGRMMGRRRKPDRYPFRG